MTHLFPRPRKALGQNFLTDQNIVRKILAAAALQPSDQVLEVGPGRGALTALLAERVNHLVAVEFDRDLAALLRQQYQNSPTVLIHEQDVLQVDFAALLGEGTYKVVANLPYNISTPVLFRFLEERHRFSRLVVMLQKEVGERLAAAPDCSDYGVLTVLFRQWFEVRREFLVPPDCFFPAPKVDSVVISLVPLSGSRVVVGDQELFEKVVRAAFAMRRKTLWNCLKSSGVAEVPAVEAALNETGINGQRRGETLSLDEFAALSRALQKPA
ncbi:MAG: 16S rRNA (adenine(1518)-N(6)/adenine(1519)-N(6))-dimethyltransferase RsmA [Geobacter sp.]|nr:16S rRNA (adenine(1518)-N(6)/adenine(1519)-N(6))-dimethyltransferase RsmA [Geobacter sp.]